MLPNDNSDVSHEHNLLKKKKKEKMQSLGLVFKTTCAQTPLETITSEKMEGGTELLLSCSPLSSKIVSFHSYH